MRNAHEPILVPVLAPVLFESAVDSVIRYYTRIILCPLDCDLRSGHAIIPESHVLVLLVAGHLDPLVDQEVGFSCRSR